MREYKIFDSRRMCYVLGENGMEYSARTYGEANHFRWLYIQQARFQFPITAVVIHEFDNGICRGEVMDIIMN